jgi:hypothetical protein
MCRIAPNHFHKNPCLDFCPEINDEAPNFFGYAPGARELAAAQGRRLQSQSDSVY